MRNPNEALADRDQRHHAQPLFLLLIKITSVFGILRMLKEKRSFGIPRPHVLAQAILRLFPEAKPTIGPPIENGFYYDFANLTISDADFEKIEKEMQKIVEENYKPERHVFKDKKEALQRSSKEPLQSRS